MAKISNKSQQMPASAIRKLVPFADAAKEEGVKVYHLNVGQPDIKSPECALEAVRKNTLDHVSYSNSAGLIELRRGLVEKYYRKIGIDIDVEYPFFGQSLDPYASSYAAEAPEILVFHI